METAGRERALIGSDIPLRTMESELETVFSLPIGDAKEGYNINK
jgi:hypothetical protein